jgi:hypothetical protein
VSFGEHELRNESLRRRAQAHLAAFFPKGRMENDPDAEQSVSALVTSSRLSVKKCWMLLLALSRPSLRWIRGAISGAYRR